MFKDVSEHDIYFFAELDGDTVHAWNLRLATGHQDHYNITHNRKLEDVT